MKSSISNTVKGIFQAANQWFLRTPERALDEAYDAALSIKAIEDTHFDGRRISPDYGNYSNSVNAYFQAELKKYLKIAKMRLAEFKASSSLFRTSNFSNSLARNSTDIQIDENSADGQTIDVIDKPRTILKKLKFIDEVLVRYSAEKKSEPQSEKRRSSQNGDRSGRFKSDLSSLSAAKSAEANTPTARQMYQNSTFRDSPSSDNESFVDKTGVLPRSILRTVDRIKRELDPKAENEIVEEFRDSKTRTIVSLRFILLLIIIPLLTQQVSKNFVVGPIVDYFRGDQPSQVFLNTEMEEEALSELQRYEERFRFEILIGKIPPISEEEIESQVKERAEEIENQYRKYSSDAIKNVFSDILSVLAFAGVLVSSKREIAILKSFVDELIYGLSDSAKAFIIILFTDMFVGFHSPHGWEVLLEGISRHFGFPANRDFIFLFIATFPVILDTVFKYWIFRYLNRISPSAVATYKNMNET
ncbi:MAG TPA: proton extrusion protein PcxA [Elainellaceae cyanobacterium]